MELLFLKGSPPQKVVARMLLACIFLTKKREKLSNLIINTQLGLNMYFINI